MRLLPSPQRIQFGVKGGPVDHHRRPRCVGGAPAADHSTFFDSSVMVTSMRRVPTAPSKVLDDNQLGVSSPIHPTGSLGCHGAEFDPSHGARPIAGPAPTPLERIPVAIDQSTGNLVVTS